MAEARPFFSVIIPLFNKELYISRSIDSVLAQKFKDFELLIIDDKSTDKSLSIARSYKDSRIRFFNRKNPGPGGYAARNMGIAKSNSNWIAFLDADDTWDPNHLQNYYHIIKNYPDASVLSCGWNIVKPDNSQELDAYYRSHKTNGVHKIAIPEFCDGPRPLWTSVVAAHKKLLLNVGGFNEKWKHGADTDLWLKLILFNNNKCIWIPKIGATYFQNITHSVTKNLGQTKAPCTDTIKNFLKGNKAPIETQNSLLKFLNRINMTPLKRLSQTKPIRYSDLTDRFSINQLAFRQIILILFYFLKSNLLNFTNKK